jgi:hypothetical protein
MVAAYQIGLEDCLGARREVFGASPPSKRLKRERKTVWQTGCLGGKDGQRPSERAPGYNTRKDIVPYLSYSPDGILSLQRSEVQSRQPGIQPVVFSYGLSNREICRDRTRQQRSVPRFLRSSDPLSTAGYMKLM